MPTTAPHSSRPVLLTAAGLLLGLTPAALARGGGGGGFVGGGGGIGWGFHGGGSADARDDWRFFGLGLTLLAISVAYAGLLHWLLARKSRQAQALLARLADANGTWQHEALQRRIKEVYVKVQKAWTARNQDLAKDSVSDQLYQRHKAQTDAMIRHHRQNILKNISLDNATVVGVADYAEDARDAFWVFIEGSMIDYTIDDRSGVVLKGDEQNPEHFHELWQFVRGEHDWMLHHIVQESVAGVIGLEFMHSFSRVLSGQQPLRRYGHTEP
jgi:hypothetical protein